MAARLAGHMAQINPLKLKLTKEHTRNIARFVPRRNRESAAEFGCGQGREKAVAHLLTIGFFMGLLVALAILLEQMVKAHWAEIIGALRGEAVRPAPPIAARRAVARRAAA